MWDLLSSKVWRNCAVAKNVGLTTSDFDNIVEKLAAKLAKTRPPFYFDCVYGYGAYSRYRKNLDVDNWMNFSDFQVFLWEADYTLTDQHDFWRNRHWRSCQVGAVDGVSKSWKMPHKLKTPAVRTSRWEMYRLLPLIPNSPCRHIIIVSQPLQYGYIVLEMYPQNH